MLYGLSRRALFQLDAEQAHNLTIKTLKNMPSLAVKLSMNPGVPKRPVQLMGLDFANPVGLAAGLDKDGECIDAFGAMGFGFVEVGTVTPRPQAGNPKPRLFRLTEQGAIINRMGFNNQGVDAMLPRLQRRSYQGVLGVNIGKNKDTPNEQAVDDYLYCLERVYPHADYVTVNISSPNTPGLRDLQSGDSLAHLLEAVKSSQARLASDYRRYVPIAVKVAPDMDAEQIALMAETLVQFDVDGVIATNTTLTRPNLNGVKDAEEAGGLSGKPAQACADLALSHFSEALNGRIPLLGVGGIDSAEAALKKRAAGAELVQLYTGFIYRGPALIRQIAKVWS